MKDAPLSAAERAVLHIVRRVQEDVDFAAVMQGTESLRLCIRATAKHQGEDAATIRDRVHAAIANNPGESETARLNCRLQQAGRDLAELRSKKEATERDIASGRAALNAIGELLRIAELGHPDVLTIDNIRDALTGGPLLKHGPDKIGSVSCGYPAAARKQKRSPR